MFNRRTMTFVAAFAVLAAVVLALPGLAAAAPAETCRPAPDSWMHWADAECLVLANVNYSSNAEAFSLSAPAAPLSAADAAYAARLTGLADYHTAVSAADAAYTARLTGLADYHATVSASPRFHPGRRAD